ncbi:Hpt domain-containing protein [Pseudodesulfovibrio tunisiensis]|uniref:Hpt domain-containing protein n=1 Tax=Pseudodesulfovibrio tunisiensis TaxID=463192 RepID=UPI001FB1E1FF|nr:Hpt domain-containing protein [Pseudodesulfovibrio tunisiensis]
MTPVRDHVLEIFIEETEERLNNIEAGLLELEKCGDHCDPDLVNSVFRDAHSVKAGCNLLKLHTIEDLAHKLENVLELIRRDKLAPTELVITASLEAVDKLRELVEDVENSDGVSIRLHTAMLDNAIQMGGASV